MPVFATKFVWENEPPKETKKEAAKKVALEPLDDDYINLTKDGTLRIKRSQYTEDMIGHNKSLKDINNKKNNKKE